MAVENNNDVSWLDDVADATEEAATGAASQEAEEPVGEPVGEPEHEPEPEVQLSLIAEDLRAVIANRNYKLSDMLSKLSRLWIEDQITEADYDFLVEYARENANPDSEGDVLAAVRVAQADVKELRDSIASLADRVAALEGEEPEPEPVQYPEYVVGRWYYNGDTVSFEGKSYKCIAPAGQVCVWSPKDYPVYWEEVKDAA